MTVSVIRVRPERFVAGGAALGHAPDGRVVFVRGGLPGDDVSAEVVDDRGSFVHAVVADLHERGPDRVELPCPQRSAGCGGCDWQHVAVPAQLPHKAAIVVDALRRTARLPHADVRAGAAVPAEGYRTTVRVVGDAEGRPAYRKERSHDTVPAAGCLVAAPDVRARLATPDLLPGEERVVRSSEPPVVAGVTFQVSPGSFFQSGPAAAELLVDAVRRAAPELAAAARVVDAYAGVGLFAATVVPGTAHVTTIESSASAVADSRVNLAGRDATIVAGEVGRWRATPADVVIADPARSGLAKPGVRALVGTGAPVFVLVSCDPVSLARDVALLAGHGYRHEYTEVLDLFPHTHHVEAVTRLVRG